MFYAPPTVRAKRLVKQEFCENTLSPKARETSACTKCKYLLLPFSAMRASQNWNCLLFIFRALFLYQNLLEHSQTWHHSNRHPILHRMVCLDLFQYRSVLKSHGRSKILNISPHFCCCLSITRAPSIIRLRWLNLVPLHSSLNSVESRYV